MPDSDEFERLAHSYRRELLAYCYRMLGSGDGSRDGVDLAVRLMERSLRYLLSTLDDVTEVDLRRSTPCTQWDLGSLLHHLQDSMDALREGLNDGRIEPPAPADDPPAEGPSTDNRAAVLGVRTRASGLLVVLATAAGEHRTPDREHRTPGREHRTPDRAGDRMLAIGDRVLATSTLALVGALELTVHGWDVSWAGGVHRPIPVDLAADLLMVSPLVIPPGDRSPHFTAPVAPAPASSAGDRLVAYLGRRPGRSEGPLSPRR